MWKLILGFVLFAAIAMFALFKGGGDLDMGGEKHGADAVGHDVKPPAGVSSGVEANPAGSK